MGLTDLGIIPTSERVPEQTNTNLFSLPFALDYGLENGPTLGAGEMTNDQFIDSITNFKWDYDYSSNPSTYATDSFWESLVSQTSDTVNSATGYVWNTATGTWESIKSGASNVINAVTDAGSKIASFGTGLFDSILTRALIVFAVLVLGLYILARTGILHDAASIFLATRGA